MDKIFIVHFQPLEKYPPVINLIRFLARENRNAAELHVISTDANKDKKLLAVNGVHIHRLVSWENNMSRLQRALFYFNFNRKALSLLRKHKPQKVLYYETLSAFAPCVYKKYINRKSHLFIHYHEYSSPEEYRNGMVLTRWLHALERRLYNFTHWVSHTNEYRLKLFLRDIQPVVPPKTFVLPNYPPLNWRQAAGNQNGKESSLLRFVYVGALSLDTMYVEQFARFVKERADTCVWDIYTDNYSTAAIHFLDSLKANNIFFKGGVGYDELPQILPGYDIGVILYKGHIPNYIHNAPNKLFEYLACGLNVWFPAEIKGCLPYVTRDTYPLVMEVDFNELDDMQLDPAKSKKGIVSGRSEHYCDIVLPLLTEQLLDRGF